MAAAALNAPARGLGLRRLTPPPALATLRSARPRAVHARATADASTTTTAASAASSDNVDATLSSFSADPSFPSSDTAASSFSAAAAPAASSPAASSHQLVTFFRFAEVADPAAEVEAGAYTRPLFVSN
jgi:hypothetical protein